MACSVQLNLVNSLGVAMHASVAVERSSLRYIEVLRAVQAGPAVAVVKVAASRSAPDKCRLLATLAQITLECVAVFEAMCKPTGMACEYPKDLSLCE